MYDDPYSNENETLYFINECFLSSCENENRSEQTSGGKAVKRTQKLNLRFCINKENGLLSTIVIHTEWYSTIKSLAIIKL